MLEQYPDEAWKTNVLGTLNVLNAAREVNVGTFVNVSTDKAANPTSVLGHSKRVAEKLTGWMAEQTGGRYLSVRFGNVIGSLWLDAPHLPKPHSKRAGRLPSPTQTQRVFS